MTTRVIDNEITHLAEHHGNIVFGFIRASCTFVAIDYRDGWQCYMAFGEMEAEAALRVGTLMPVRAAREVFPGRQRQPYYYADRRGRQ